MEVLKTVVVEFCGTKDQHADSLAKFLRGGPEQQRALEHLCLKEIEPESEDGLEPEIKVEKYVVCRAHAETFTSTDFKSGF